MLPLFIFAQSAPPTPKAPPTISAPFPLQSAPAAKSSPSAGQAGAQANSAVTIKTDDFLDRAGLGAVADAAVMSALALLTGAVLAGALLAILRRAFTSIDEQRSKWEQAEKMWLDLTIRKARATAEITGVERQITAVRKRQEA